MEILKKKDKYYNISRINKTDALYRMIIGQRSNGKTYSVLKQVLEKKCNKNLPSAYIRRYAETITPKNLAELFNPFNHTGNGLIEKLTGGQWNTTSYKANKFVFAWYDEEKGKITDTSKDVIMYTGALNTWENTKGADKGEIAYLIFDEFMSREGYLTNEFVLFMNVVSSFIRDRDSTIIYLLGNTVSKYCPYFAEFGIKGIEKMKKGEIQVIHYDTKGLTMAIEYCDGVEATRKVSKYFAFQNPRLSMITGGEWEIPHYPHIPISINEDVIIKRVFIKFDGNIIACDICRDVSCNGMILCVHEHNKTIQNENKQLIYCREPDSNPLHVHDLRSKPTKINDLFIQLVLQSKVFYSTNDVGEIFSNFFMEFTNTKKRV